MLPSSQTIQRFPSFQCHLGVLQTLHLTAKAGGKHLCSTSRVILKALQVPWSRGTQVILFIGISARCCPPHCLISTALPALRGSHQK